MTLGAVPTQDSTVVHAYLGSWGSMDAGLQKGKAEGIEMQLHHHIHTGPQRPGMRVETAPRLSDADSTLRIHRAK